MVLQSLFALETLPSTLAVMALVVFILGKYRSKVCGTNESCDSVLSKANMIAIVSCGLALLICLLVCCGVITVSGSMSGGMYGGGYGGGYGGMF